ncbi:baseplate J/gp47 family protein [Morganella morganii]|uniref:baseplate J/gp47 family protein n=1 Tax=Morganella morganii TaxID=582 RepID=UPI003C12C157
MIDEDGKASAPVSATTPGTVSNISVITLAELVSAPMGVNSRVLIQPLNGGTDRETDAALLARLLDLIRRPPCRR